MADHEVLIDKIKIQYVNTEAGIAALTTENDELFWVKENNTLWIGKNGIAIPIMIKVENVIGGGGTPGTDIAMNTDAFGRLRVSQLTTLADIKQTDGNSDIIVDKVAGGTGGYVWNSTDSSTTISVPTISDYVVHQTKQYYNYQSGKSFLIMFTFYDFHSEAGIVKRMGYFTSSTVAPYNTGLDGLFLESDDTGISVNIYKGGTLIEKTHQTSWDASQIEEAFRITSIELAAIDWSKNQIIYIDFEWLGVGTVRWGLVLDGQIKYFHASNHANVIQGVYMRTPNNPLRWEIRNISSGVGGDATYVCATASSEGSTNKIGKVFSENLGIDSIRAQTTGVKYALMGMRLNATSNNTVDMLDMTMMTATNDNFYYELWLNPTVSGTFTYSSISDSSIEIAKGATNGSNQLSGGALMASGYSAAKLPSEFIFDNAIRLGRFIDGTRDEFVLSGSTLTTGADMYASVTWTEIS